MHFEIKRNMKRIGREGFSSEQDLEKMELLKFNFFIHNILKSSFLNLES
jgi:hypothetical protein